MEFIIWTAPSTGVRKYEQRDDTTNEQMTTQDADDVADAGVQCPTEKETQFVVPIQPNSQYELIRFRLPDVHIPGDIDTSSPSVLKNFLLTQGLQVSHLHFRSFPNRPWSEIAEQIHQECIHRCNHSAHYVRRVASELVSFNWLMVAPESMVLQARMSRVPSDTESTSEQPSKQLANTSLLACAPALGDRDAHARSMIHG